MRITVLIAIIIVCLSGLYALNIITSSLATLDNATSIMSLTSNDISCDSRLEQQKTELLEAMRYKKLLELQSKNRDLIKQSNRYKQLYENYKHKYYLCLREYRDINSNCQ